MKKLVSCSLAALFICFAANTAAAQYTMSAGVQGGISVATLGGDQSEDNPSSKVGFAFGGFFAVDLHEYFRLQVQGQYVQKGAEFPDFDDEKTKVDYIEVLLPLTVTIPVENSPIGPRLFAGPAVGFLTTCEFEFTDGDTVDCKDFTKSVDFGVFFGGGVDYMVGNGAITLDVLYNLGLTNINDGDDADVFSVKNRNFQALAGYRFFFGG